MHGSNGIDKHIAVNTNKVFRVQDAVLVLHQGSDQSFGRLYALSRQIAHLTGSVDDFGGVLLSFELDNFAKSILNGRIVALYKMSIDELDRQGRFACCASISQIPTCRDENSMKSIPTDRLPTIAIFLCFGGAVGILARPLGDARQYVTVLRRAVVE